MLPSRAELRMEHRTDFEYHEPVPKKMSARRVGLARAISKMGYCSRSQAIVLIHTGRVQLNGKARCDPEAPVRLGQDRIQVDGHAVESRENIYLMMNKPRGLVTTASDEKGNRTVYSVLHSGTEALPWVSPVGRLDKASEGMLLLTNDSEWGARIAAPETHLEKTYHVQVGTVADNNLTEALVTGVRTEERGILHARRASLLRSGGRNSWLEITLDEGKNRQIRRMLAALGIKVLRLVRVAIGPLQLGRLAKGDYRSLTAEEKLALDRAMAAKQASTHKA